MATITIIGSGMMGSALAFPARENGNTVRLVGTHLDREIIDECRKTNRHPKFAKHFPKGVPPFPAGCEFYQIEQMDEAVKGADLVIGGVSSFGVDWFGEEVLPKIPVEIPVLSVTKGLLDTDDAKLLTYPAVWEARLAAKGIKRDICAIGGPCTSYELVDHDQTEVAFCGKDIEVLRKIKAIMATDYYHISLSTDVVGGLREQQAAGRYIGAICAAPGFVLATHGIITDGPATGYPGCEAGIRNCTGRDVEHDAAHRIITSRGPGLCLSFALELLRALEGPQVASKVAEGMLITAQAPTR